MASRSKKITMIALTALLLFSILPMARAEEGLVLLAPLDNENSEPIQGLPDYLHYAFPIFVGLAITLAVVMITIGAIQYMFSGVPGAKGEGLKRIREAIWGLLLALTAFLILRTINPDLVNLNLDLRNSSNSPSTNTNTEEDVPLITIGSEG